MANFQQFATSFAAFMEERPAEGFALPGGANTSGSLFQQQASLVGLDSAFKQAAARAGATSST
jgi:hypothetical protein